MKNRTLASRVPHSAFRIAVASLCVVHCALCIAAAAEPPSAAAQEGVRLIVVHPDGSFETEIGTLDHPFPVRDDGKPYRPAAPQPLPRAAPAAASAPAAAESPASPHHQSHGYWLGSIFFLLASELA